MQERVLVVDVARIYRLWNQVAAAANEGNLDRLMALWSDDGVQMSPGAPRRVGKREIRRAMQSLLDHFDTSMTIQPEEVRILGDHAYSHGTYELALTPKDGGRPERESGQFLGILDKQADGSWKIAIDCRNSSRPGCNNQLCREQNGNTIAQREVMWMPDER